MLEILKSVMPSPEQMEMVIEGMRNHKNSWDRSDSYKTVIEDPQTHETADFEFFIGENDLQLMSCLVAGGPVHAKYRRMMPVFVTINAPLYWWKEFDTYKIGTVCNICSTMHKIHAKPFDISDFSCEHLMTVEDYDGDEHDIPLVQYRTDEYVKFSPKGVLNITIDMLNLARERYLTALKTEEHTGYSAKDIWWQMIQLLPSSYNQRRTIMLNYEVLANIYKSRKDHKLDEWHTFCEWIENLPYSELITNDNIFIIGVDLNHANS